MMKLINLSQFCENPDNPQTVTEEAFADLVKSIERDERCLEFRKIAYVTDYTALSGESFAGRCVVLDGNKRLRALKKIHGEEASVPSSYFFDITGMTEEERKRWLIRANIQTGEWDADALAKLYSAEELADITTDESLAELLESVEPAPSEGKTDPDATPAVDTSTPPASRRGGVYLLGNHRLMCGDSTKAEDVARLMAGEKAMLVITDPPYGVAIGDKNKTLNDKNGSKSIERNILNDDIPPDELHGVLVQAFTNARTATESDGAYYVFSPQGGNLGMMMMMMRDAGLAVRHMLIWVKSSATFSMGRLDYDYRHEPIFYTWTKSHHFYATEAENTVFEDKVDVDKLNKSELKDMLKRMLADGNTPTTVLHEPKPARCDLHPTMKPVRLIGRLMANSSRRGDIVLDPFGGSGTTVIAAEQLGRNCRTIEMDPLYCDVIRRRWAEFVHGEGCDWQALTPESTAK